MVILNIIYLFIFIIIYFNEKQRKYIHQKRTQP